MAMTKKTITKGVHQVFPLQFYSAGLIDLFQQAITQLNPALFLHQRKARSPLFMMESLLRLLEATYPDKAIKLAVKTIKKLEDQLGEIDNYDQQLQKFSGLKTVKKEHLAYFEFKREKALSKLNRQLNKHGFFQDVFNILSSEFRVNFNNQTLILKIEDELKLELKTAFHFFMEHPKPFKDMELEVHELRRKLRWISIYGQSLQGVIVFKNESKKFDWQKEYPASVLKNQSYNKLPLDRKFKQHIHINPKAFIALNVVIEKLGTIKDKGLDLQALQKAIIKTDGLGKKRALKVATNELKATYSEKDLLKEAHVVLHDFFVKHKIQEKLLTEN